MEKDEAKNRKSDLESSSESESEDYYSTEMLGKDIKKCKKIEGFSFLLYLCRQVERNLRKAENILNSMPITCKSHKRFLKLAKNQDQEITEIEEKLIQNNHEIAKAVSRHQGSKKMIDVAKKAKELSDKFLTKLSEAEDEMNSELKKRNLYLTDKVEDISNHHELPEFTGVLTEEASHYYEYIEEMNYYYEMMDITKEDEGGVMWESLKGEAKLSVWSELGYKAPYNKDRMQEFLKNRYGNPQLLIRKIQSNHEMIGKIPDKPYKTYKEMEDMTRKHMIWCRKAISLEKAQPGTISILYNNMLSWVLPMYASANLYYEQDLTHFYVEL